MLPTLAAGAMVAGMGVSDAKAVLFISEYVEGSGNNKAIEIYNNGSSAVDLAATNTTLQFFFNGSTSAGTTIPLTGSIAAGGTYVVADNDASAAILAVTNQQSTSNFYNGDDAIVLSQGATVLDVIGQVGVDPGTEWGTGLTSTADNTIRRNFAVVAGDTDGSNAFDPSTEWTGFAQDTFSGLGTHSGATPPPPPPPPGPFAGTLFINEVEYDQTSTDDAEFIELAGLAGSYSNVQLLLINGSNDTIYQTINVPDFVLADESDGYGFLVLAGIPANVPNTDIDLSPDTNLLQNGEPDAIALLVDGVLVHYLSYAGTTGLLIDGQGPNDITFLDDSGSTLGISLQKVGTGSDFGDFIFDALPSTPGAVNTRQTFVAAATAVPEPVTFSMLVIGGVALMTRRQRIA